MPSVAKPTLQCARCGKRYVWQPTMAGKRVKCNCGSTLSPPAGSPPPIDGPPPMLPTEPAELYDLIDPPKPVPAVSRAPVAPPAFLPPIDLDDDGLCCPDCGLPMEPGRVICTHCGFNFRTGQTPSKPAPIPAVRKQTVAPPSMASAPAAPRQVTTFIPPSPDRYMTEKAGPPVRRIAAVAAAVLLIFVAIVWHALTAATVPALNSGKGEDPEVNEMIADDGATELHHWFDQDPHRLAGEFSPSQAIALADHLQEIGATKVLAFGPMMSLALAIELPPEPAKRTALFKWENKFAADNFYKPDKDVGQHYLLLRLHP